MEIAIVVHDDVTIDNGTTVRVKRTLALLSRYHMATIVTSSSKATKIEGCEGVRIINLGGHGAGRLAKVRPSFIRILPIALWSANLASVIMKNRFDLLFCANDKFGFLALYLLSKIRKYKLIFEAHGIFSEQYKEISRSGLGLRLIKLIEKLVIQYADRVIALSPNILEFYRRYNARIELLPVFLDDELFRASEKRPRNDSLKRVGLIGPFDTTRNVSSLQFLYSNINKFDNRLHFVVIGRCEHRIYDHRLEYTGYLPSTQDYIRQLSCLDAVLVVEKIATSGPLNKIVEPMACGVPVFTTPKGMVGLYWVEPGRDIFVFEEDELVDKINELIFDDEPMRKVGENARKTVERYYSKKANEEKLLKILETVVSDKNA